MKRFLMVGAIIVLLLVVVELTILKDGGLIEQAKSGNQYEKISDLESLPLGIEKDTRALPFSLTTLEGDTVSLEDYRGKKVLLNFWATWCPPCRAEMPDMEEMYKDQKNEDVVVLAVNMTMSESSREDVEQFIHDYELTFPILMDEVGEVGHQYEVLSYPTSLFIDSDGVIRSKVIGALSKEHMVDEINRLP